MSKAYGLDFAKAQTDLFHKNFGHQINSKPTMLTRDQVQIRANFLAEELVELLGAVATTNTEHQLMTERLIHSVYKAQQKQQVAGFKLKKEDRLVALADSLTDINYFTQGTFTMMGVNPQPLFDIVQKANMSKLFPDGKPHYREEDGKVIKPEGWEAPEPQLKKEIEFQKLGIFRGGNFKVNDKVIVKENLKVGEYYPMNDGQQKNTVVTDMLKECGKIVKIIEVHSHGYRIENSPYTWTDKMFV